MKDKTLLLEELLIEGKKKGYIVLNKILSVLNQESEEFDEFLKKIEAKGIDLVKKVPAENSQFKVEAEIEDDLDPFSEMESDPEFSEFTSEIENDLKTKDIDDIVSSVSPIQTDDLIKMYLREIGQRPLLTTDQEIRLSSEVQQGILAKDIIANKDKIEIEFTKDQIEQFYKDVEIGNHARDVLIESNLRLVISIAKRYLSSGMQFQDLIQEGNMGLMKAVAKFDHTKGFKFSTYATWWIRQAITRAIADQARTIRIPVHMGETINKLKRTQRKLVQELRREPTPEEIGAEMGISPEKVQEIQKNAQEIVPLDTPVKEDEDSVYADFVKDDKSPNPLEYTLEEKYKEEINTVLKTLTPREEKVLRLRYGLMDGKFHTLEDVGKEFGVTRERIRQIESKAIRKLKHPTRQRLLSQFKDFN